jgi:hypothetical protein
LASPRENQRNKKKPKSNTSGVKGVSWRRDRKTWSVRISTGDKQASLGSFSNIEDAREAYASGAQKYFGEFARME